MDNCTLCGKGEGVAVLTVAERGKQIRNYRLCAFCTDAIRATIKGRELVWGESDA